MNDLDDTYMKERGWTLHGNGSYTKGHYTVRRAYIVGWELLFCGRAVANSQGFAKLFDGPMEASNG